MVRSNYVTIEGTPITELESGNYKIVLHVSGLLQPLSSIIAFIKERALELLEGADVTEVKIIDVGPHLPEEENLIWSEPELHEIAEPHTDVEIYFTVASPLMLSALIYFLMIVTVIIAATTFLQTLYKMPEPIIPIAGLGIGLLILLLLFMMRRERR